MAGIGGLMLPMMGCLASTAAADTTLVLFEHDTEQNFLDRGEPGPGPGDQLLFAGDVFDYRTARSDGTIQVPVDVPDQTDATLDVVTA